MSTGSAHCLAGVVGYFLYFLAYFERRLWSGNELFDHFGVVGSGLLDDVECEGGDLFVEYVFVLSYEFEDANELFFGEHL